MDKSRRRFLQFAGGAALVAAGGTLASKAVASSSTHSAAASGTQWAMVVDLAKVAGRDMNHLARACHNAHNVPDIGNKKDEVKWLWSVPYENAFPDQHHAYAPDFLKSKDVLVLCNHCSNPPCVRACPTKATFKRDDGIVAMDFHRCIGCRFCISACPYGARSLNFRDPRPFIKNVNKEFPTRTRGVVEKCNFCLERQVKGLQPACVEACTDEELIFGKLNDSTSRVREVLRNRYTVLRKTALGTSPNVFYVV